MFPRLLMGLSLASVGAFGCAAPVEDTAVGVHEQAIVDGTESGNPAVVQLLHDGRESCSGVLLAPRLVATALHCLANVFEGGAICSQEGVQLNGEQGGLGVHLNPNSLTVVAPSVGAESSGARILSTGSTTVCRDDLAFLVLDRAIVLEEYPTPSTTPVRRGQRVDVHGFGVQRGEIAPEAAQRRSVPVLTDADENGGRAFAVGQGPCYGDSGGPAIDEAGHVVGTLSLIDGAPTRDAKGCASAATRARYTELLHYPALVHDAYAASADAVVAEPEEPRPVSSTPPVTTPPSAIDDGVLAGGSCQITAPGRSGAAWFFASLAALLVLRRRPVRRALAVAMLALAAVTTVPSVARADTPTAAALDEAKRRFEQGKKFYEEGDYRLARVEFERAYELSHNAKVLYNLGQVNLQLNNYGKARQALEQYAAEVTLDATRKASVDKDLAFLKERTATLTVTSNVAGVDVVIDEQSVGLTPLAAPLLLDSGTHRIVAEKSGFESLRQTVTLAGTEKGALTLKLVPLASRGPIAPPRSTVLAPQVTYVPAAVAWSATGAVAAGAAVVHVLALGTRNDFDDVKARESSTAEREEAASKARNFTTVADILTATAIVGAGVSLYFTIRPPTRKGHATGMYFAGDTLHF